MTAYKRIWDVAEDNHGVITSAQARRLGISAAAVVSMAASGKLIKVGHGVYKLDMHVPTPYDEYAQAVAMVGETGFIRGASALMFRGLIPYDPARFYLGVSKRIRRRLSDSYDVKFVANPQIEHIEGIPVEKVPAAREDAWRSGAIDADRLKELEVAR